MREDWTRDDSSECIRTEEDLFRFSETSLDWLESKTGVRITSQIPNEETGRQVAELIHNLRHSFPGFGILTRSVLAACERAWTRGKKKH